MKMIHQHHYLDELNYKVWIFSEETAFRQMNKTISADRKLRTKLKSGCHSLISYYLPSCFIVPGINDKGNEIMVIFTYCSTMIEKAVFELSDWMKNFGGKELTAEEIKHLVRLLSMSLFLGQERPDVERMSRLLVLKLGSLGK